MADNTQKIQEVLSAHWKATLGDLIKPSQNYTYKGTIPSSSSASDAPCVVRVVPKGAENIARVSTEANLLLFIASSPASTAADDDDVPLKATKIIPSVNGEPFIHHKDDDVDIIVLCFEWAEGRAVDFFSWEHMSNKSMVTAVARSMAKFHKISKQLSKVEAFGPKHVRNWRELHDNVLKDAVTSEEDEQLATNPDCFGVLHGDVNSSNYFVIGEDKKEDDDPAATAIHNVYLFDWDQLQLGWYMYDVAQVIHGATMFQWAKGEFMGKECTVHNLMEFVEWTIAGYEAEMNRGASSPAAFHIDRPHLLRMLALRREFYITFALREIEHPTLPEGMHQFCHLIKKNHEESVGDFEQFKTDFLAKC